MKRRPASPMVSLFPFLSVLVCTMGILAFISITFILESVPDIQQQTEHVTIEWTGAPAYVQPIIFRCRDNRVSYYDLFEKQEKILSLEELLGELKGENSELKKYLHQLAALNQQIKRNFGEREYYPLLLVYPDGIWVTEFLTPLIEQVGTLNMGLEPMKDNWKDPYSDISRRTE
ncbi:MAG: hypothetical protein HQM12_07345 [SAR324 cluster bacterium]|nr:hypothetical protein [SAR324 cluster bacterium]MBF0351966.1 hypothetical protein [SAR324 cluster bacterium]